MSDLPSTVRRSLAHASASPESHPDAPHLDADLLTAFSEQSLAQPERERVLLHLAVCADCRQVLALSAPEAALAAQSEAPARAAAAVGRPGWSWMALRFGSAMAVLVIAGGAALLYRNQQQQQQSPVVVTTGGSARSSAPPSQPPVATKEAATSATSQKVQSAVTTENKTSAPTRDQVAKAKVEALPQPQAKKFAEAKDSAGAGALAASKPPAPSRSAQATFMARQDAAVPAPPQAESASAALSKVSVPSTVQIVPVDAPSPAERAASNTAIMSLASTNPPASLSPQDRNFADAQSIGSGLQTRQVTHRTPPALLYRFMRPAPLGNAFAQGPSPNMFSAHAHAGAPFATSQWAIAMGHVEHSTDGRMWQAVAVAPGVFFRVVASNGSEVWAGGDGGTLYHSSDGGTLWTRVTPAAGGQVLRDDVSSLAVSDPTHVVLGTADGRTWSSSDAGQHWQIVP